MRNLSVRAALALVSALASLAGAGGAQAHALINAGNVYDNGNQCVYNATAQTHSFNSVIVQSLTNTPPFHFPVSNCTYRNSKPSGYLAGRWEQKHRWYGLRTGRDTYAEKSLAAMAWLFPA